EQGGQAAPEIKVHGPGGLQGGPQCPRTAVEARRAGGPPVGRPEGGGAICLLDEQPTPGPHPGYQPPKGPPRGGGVHQEGTAVEEVVVGASSSSSRMLCRRTSRLGSACPPRKRGLRSVARTRPPDPTRPASQRATEPAPALTSRQRQPGPTPRSVRR